MRLDHQKPHLSTFTQAERSSPVKSPMAELFTLHAKLLCSAELLMLGHQPRGIVVVCVLCHVTCSD